MVKDDIWQQVMHSKSCVGNISDLCQLTGTLTMPTMRIPPPIVSSPSNISSLKAPYKSSWSHETVETMAKQACGW